MNGLFQTNFRLHLWLAMKRKLAKVRSIASLFLEVLMLVFIFTCANVSFTSTDTSKDSEPFKGFVLRNTIALSNSSASQAFYILTKNQIQDNDTFSLPVDLHGECIALSAALSISQFERNTFYIASADNIP